MRAGPDHGSERVSQALFAEIVTIDSEEKGFFHIRQNHGYSGWADIRLIAELGPPKDSDEHTGAEGVIISLFAKAYDAAARHVSPHSLCYGTRLRTTDADGGWAEVHLPDDNSVFVKKSHLRPINDSNSKKTPGSMLVREARKFLGVPYLWGGVSSFGCDCSGLVQSVFRSCGIDLPRDTRDQIKVGEPVNRAHIRAGDLLFFDRHVAIACGRTEIIHASRAAGGVRLESLWQSDPRYRADLDRDFAQARRVI